MSKFKLSLIISLIAIVALIFSSVNVAFVILFILGMFLFWFAMSMMINMNFFIRSTHHTTPNNVLLTFDDGPDKDLTPHVLEILKKHNAQAGFFVIGKKIKENETLLLQMQNEGHIIGNHSFSHPLNFGRQSKKKVIKDLVDCNKEITRASTRTSYFRPPFGVTNPNIAFALHVLKMKSIGWSLRTFDTKNKSPNFLLANILNKVKGGDIILLHDTQKITVAILDPLILELRKRGFTLNAELINE